MKQEQRDNMRYGDDLPGLSMRLQESLSEAKITVERLKKEIEKETNSDDGSTRKDLKEIHSMLKEALQKTNMLILANGVTDWSKV